MGLIALRARHRPTSFNSRSEMLPTVGSWPTSLSLSFYAPEAFPLLRYRYIRVSMPRPALRSRGALPSSPLAKSPSSSWTRYTAKDAAKAPLWLPGTVQASAVGQCSKCALRPYKPWLGRREEALPHAVLIQDDEHSNNRDHCHRQATLQQNIHNTYSHSRLSARDSQCPHNCCRCPLTGQAPPASCSPAHPVPRSFASCAQLLRPTPGRRTAGRP
jgi:hypothetical protein